MIAWIMKRLKSVLDVYELKHPTPVAPVFLCTSFDCRNRNKNDAYQIPEDQPQCPVYHDNRCCGGCQLAPRCDYCVCCNCYGWAYGQMGGTAENYYLHKASAYALGRIGEDGKFDWDYYKESLKRSKIIPGDYLISHDRIYKVKSKVDKRDNFKLLSCESGKQRTYNLAELEPYFPVYHKEEDARQILEIRNLRKELLS